MARTATRFSRTAALALALTIGILTAESAGAATLSRSGGIKGADFYTFQADAGEADGVTVSNAGGGRFTITDSADTITLGANTGECTGSGAIGVGVNCPAGDRLTINLEDLNDTTTITDSVAMPYVINGDAGNDSLDGGGFDDRLLGGAGADTSHSGDAGDDFIEPGASTDTGLNGGSGSDTISYDDGRGSGVTVDLESSLGGGVGTGGDSESLTSFENVEGTAFGDSLFGTTGNNVILGKASGDTIGDGLGGVDTVSYAGHATGVTVNLVTDTNSAGDTLFGDFDNAIGSSLNDNLSASGGTFATVLTGNGGEDSLTGGTLADTLEGGSDTDTLNGGDGNDRLIGGTSADSHNGGTGIDTASYEDRTAVVATLSGASQDGDTYSLIENLEGGASSDTLTGNGSANSLIGNAGADTLIGGGGADSLFGNTIAGSSDGANDTASYEERGTAVTTTLGAGAKQDGDVYSDIQNLRGGDGNDLLTGDGAVNLLVGLSGADTLVGAGAADVLRGGFADGSADSSIDVLSYRERATPVTAAIGSALPDADTASDIGGLEGGSGNDTLTGDAQPNTLLGGPGADSLVGLGSADTLNGGAGPDLASYEDRAGPVSASLATGTNPDADTLTAIEGLRGGSAGDTLTGDGSANTLDGGTGDDLLTGGLGADALTGGGGTDSATYQDGRGSGIALNLGTGTRPDGDAYTGIARIVGSDQADTMTGGAGADVLEGAGGGDQINGGDGADTLRGGNGEDILDGGAGADPVLVGDGDADVIRGGAGGDGIDGGAGRDRVSYADHPDGVSVSLAGAAGSAGSAFDGAPGARDSLTAIEDLEGSAQADELTGNGSANALDGGGGNDGLRGGGGADTLAGGAGTDTARYGERGASQPVAVSFDGNADDGAPGEGDRVQGDVENAEGGAGADTLTGDGGSNSLSGNAGNDTITGGGGADDLRGGDGDDTLRAQDGAADGVDCGAGNDQAENDAADSLTGCERQSVFVTVIDNDGDGIGVPADCNDASAAIRPGAVEIPGNDVDENCDGVRAPFPVLATAVVNAFQAFSNGTVFTALSVNRLDAGSTVTVTCKTPGKRRKGRNRCPFARRTFAISQARAKLNLARFFKRRRLPVKTKITITVTSPTAIGKRLVLQVRRGKPPSKKLTCLAPGGAKTACG